MGWSAGWSVPLLLTFVSFHASPVIVRRDQNPCDGTFPSTNCGNLEKCQSVDWSRTVKNFSQTWVELSCCDGTAATSTKWWKYKAGAWHDFSSFKTDGIILASNGRTLVFPAASIYDQGRYRCEVVYSSFKVNHDYNLVLHASTCQDLSYPIILDPINNSTVYFNMLGKSSVLPCYVNFGYCPPKRPLILNVTWLYEDQTEEETFQPLVQNNHVKLLSSSTLDEVKSNLTIKDIKEGDYRKYICHVDDGLQTKDWVIELKKGFPDTGKLPYTLIIYRPEFQIAMAIVVIIVIALIVARCIMWYKWLDFRVWKHAKYGHKKERPGSFDYDISIIHAGTNPNMELNPPPPNQFPDYRYVRNVLLERLQNEYKYQVFFPKRDMDPGSGVDDTFYEKLEKSRRIVFLVSERFLREALCGRIFSYSIRQKKRATNRNIYIIYRDIGEDTWNPDVNREFVNLETLKTCVNNARKWWLKVGKTVEWNESFPQDRNFGTDRQTAKQIETFWKKLCLALPPKPEMKDFKFLPEMPEGSDSNSACTVTSDSVLCGCTRRNRSSNYAV